MVDATKQQQRKVVDIQIRENYNKQHNESVNLEEDSVMNIFQVDPPLNAQYKS